MLLKENVPQATITAEPPQGLACMEIWGGNRKVNIKRVALGIFSPTWIAMGGPPSRG